MVAPPRQEMEGLSQASLAKNIETQGTGLSRVFLLNFKGHASLKLDMGKITVLIGPTSSGKSTVLQALNLLQSALWSDGGSLQGSNQNGHGQFTDIVTGRDESRHVAVGVDGHKKAMVQGKYSVSTKFSCRLTFDGSPYPPKLDAAVDIECESPPEEAGTMRLELSNGVGKVVMPDASALDGAIPTVRVGGGLAPLIHGDLPRCPGREAFGPMFHGGEYFRSLLNGLWHVPFSRVVTSDKLPLEYSASIMSPDRTQAAASLLSHISTDNLVLEKISSMIKEVGLKKIAMRTIPVQKNEKNMLALDFLGKGSYNTIMHEGSGLNQLATMFAILAYSPRGSVVTIEEPEIHLDPAAQARLMKIMVRQAIEEDKQLVFTTHSDHLLYPLLAYVKKKDCPLTCGDVAMYYFGTDESGEVAGAERLDINEHGQIQGGLKGFWDADMKAMGEVLG